MSAPKVVLVTGASSGIGLATAKHLAGRGYRVFGTARSPNKVESVRGVTFLPLDVTDSVAVIRAVQSVIDQAGRIDVLVNNAGAGVLGALEETFLEQAKTLFDTNVFGVVRTTQAVLPTMRAQRSGLIINVSSVLGFLPAPFLALYASSKHAIEGLSESLDHEVRGFGIRVVLVQPTFTRTGFGTHISAAGMTLSDYDAARARAAAAVAASIDSAPDARVVAEEILKAIEAPYRLRRPVGSQGRLLSRLRRFMPAGLLDRQLRKTFALD